jgi:23S rRNA pseudouridine2605 synthase
VGLVVNRLIRVSYGPFQLGELEPGQVEEVRGRVLADQLGLPRETRAEGQARRATKAAAAAVSPGGGPARAKPESGRADAPKPARAAKGPAPRPAAPGGRSGGAPAPSGGRPRGPRTPR